MSLKRTMLIWPHLQQRNGLDCEGQEFQQLVGRRDGGQGHRHVQNFEVKHPVGSRGLNKAHQHSDKLSFFCSNSLPLDGFDQRN